MSLVGVIAKFASGTYTVTRRAASTDDGHGRVVLGATSTFSMVASIQPMTGRDLKALEPAKVTEETVVIYTTATLQIGDRFPYMSSTFEVHTVRTWEAFGNTHRVAYASRTDIP